MRRKAMERLLENHPPECVECSQYLNCELDGLYLMSDGPAYHAQGEMQLISKYTSAQECRVWDHDEWNALYEELRGESDPDRRQELSLKLQEIAHYEPPILFLYNEPRVYGVSDAIDWQPRSDGRIDVSHIHPK